MHVWAKRGHRVWGKVWAQGGLRQGALESTAAEVGRQEAQCGVLMGLQVVQNLGLKGALRTWKPGTQSTWAGHGASDTLELIPGAL